MSVQQEITRITEDRNTIRTKLTGMGLASSTDNLDDLAYAIDNIVNQGAPQATVQEGQTYTISPGYYTGGTVAGVGGGGSYELQAKSVTPQTSQQVIQADTGYYGLSQVTVAAIPNNYADISSVTATAGDVLSTKVFVDNQGITTAGTMANNGAVSPTALSAGGSYTVPVGYHNGSGVVTAASLASQTVGDATAANILSGKIAWVNGSSVTGSMANNGAISGTITGLGTTSGDTSYTIPAGYTSGGTVSLTNDIETALAAI